MKNFWGMLFLWVPILSLGQGTISEKEQLWKEVVVPIQENDVDMVLDKTKFPIKVGGDELSKEEFRELYSSIFYDDVLSDLKMAECEELDWVSNGVYSFTLIGTEETYDFADVLVEKIEGSWFLVAIELEKLEEVESKGIPEGTTSNLGTVLYSEYCKQTGGHVTLFVRNKNELECGENHISLVVENVNAREVVLSVSGGTIRLEDKATLSYVYTVDCSIEKHSIVVSRRNPKREFSTLVKWDIPLP